MTPRFPSPRAQDLFAEARALPAASREAWLRRTCGDDAVLRREVDALLSNDTESGLLEPPSAEDVASWFTPPSPPDLAGRTIGSCRIAGPIGDGGMGRVYEAVQDPPGRRVAVKLLRQALPDVLSRARFEEEARCLAAIDHPGVCRVFEAGAWDLGVGDPVPYCVMELVEGARPVTRYADEERLPVEARVRLVRDVCDAVQASHAKGVLHRDLKPGNVLVGRDGRPRVIDFGIARPIEPAGRGHARLTRSGMLLGTPAYMSPEQLLGKPEDVDVRTDVHALGVVLYEVLTGRLPRDLGDGSLLAAVRAFRDTAPTPVERHDPRLAGDLSAVVRKALDPAPARRYGSAAELSEDLSRWLGRRPVVARPAGPLRAVTLWVRRNRAVAALSASLAVALLGGSTYAALTARDERIAREAADEQRGRVEAFLRQSDDFVPWILTDLQRLVAGLPRSGPVVRALTTGVRDHLRALSYDRVLDPDLLLSAAGSFLKLASIEGGFGLDRHGMRAEAREDAETARRIARRAQRIRRTAEAYEADADGAVFLGRLEQAGGDLAAARRLADEAAGALDASAGAPSTASFRRGPSVRLQVETLRADLLAAEGRHAEAYDTYRKSLLISAEGGVEISTGILWDAHQKSAQAAVRLGRPDEAEAHLRRIEVLVKRALRDGASPPDMRADLFRTHVGLADAAYAVGSPSLPWLARAVDALGAWRAVAPESRTVDREEAQLHKRIGAIQLDERRYPEAAASLTLAEAGTKRLLSEDPDDPLTWEIHLETNLVRGEVEQRLGHPDETTKRLAEAARITTHIGTTFPTAPEAWLSRCRLVLTEAAVETVAAESEAAPAAKRALLASAARKTREGGALYREGAKHGMDAGSAQLTAGLCDTEADRLDGEVAALDGK